MGPRSRGLRSQPGSSHKASSGLRVFVVKLGCDLSQAVPTDEDQAFKQPGRSSVLGEEGPERKGTGKEGGEGRRVAEMA